MPESAKTPERVINLLTLDFVSGACAVFNAALSHPSLTRFISVKNPVGHEPSRYVAIKQPCHLIFDVDDPGHPVKVGRLMRRQSSPNQTSSIWHLP